MSERNERGIEVKNTHGNQGKLSFLRIYKSTPTGRLIVAELEMNRYDPLRYLQRIVNSSKYLDDLSQQLRQHLNCEANPEGELTLEDFEYLQNEYGLKVQIC